MSKENKRYYWMKLHDNFFQNKAIKKLRRIAGGDTYTIIYLKMMLATLKTGGKLYFDKIEDEMYKEVALEIDEDEDNVKVTLAFLVNNGLVEVVDEETLFIPAVPSNTESLTASSLRSRDCRERKKVLQCNATATPLQQLCSVEIEKEIEKDIDKREDIEIDIPPAEESLPNKKAKVVRHKHGEYDNVLLSDEELEKLKSEFPNDWQERIERVSEYVASTGKSYKNFLAVIRSWARKDGANGKIQRCMVGSSQGKVRRRYEYESDEKRQELLDAWV